MDKTATTETPLAEAGAAPALSADQLIESWRLEGGPAGEIIARLDQAEAAAQGVVAERDGLSAALETANEELAAAQAALAAKDAEIAKLKGKVKVSQSERKAGKLRDFSKVDAPAGDLARRALADQLLAANRVELVLTHKGKEAGRLRPFEISGSPWVLGAAGLRLTVPLDLQGSSEDGAVSFDGYAVLADGEPVAHRARGDAVTLSPGQQMRLVDDVIF